MWNSLFIITTIIPLNQKILRMELTVVMSTHPIDVTMFVCLAVQYFKFHHNYSSESKYSIYSICLSTIPETVVVPWLSKSVSHFLPIINILLTELSVVMIISLSGSEAEQWYQLRFPSHHSPGDGEDRRGLDVERWRDHSCVIRNDETLWSLQCTRLYMAGVLLHGKTASVESWCETSVEQVGLCLRPALLSDQLRWDHQPVRTHLAIPTWLLSSHLGPGWPTLQGLCWCQSRIDYELLPDFTTANITS